MGSIKKDVENNGEDGGRDINMSGLPMDEGQGLCVGEVLLQAMLLQVVALLRHYIGKWYQTWNLSQVTLVLNILGSGKVFKN